MLPPFWGFPPVSSALLREMEAMQDRYGALFKAMLSGEPLGATPAEVVAVENKLRLLYFPPQSSPVLAVPLLIVPSPIAPSSIFDLAPGKSLVEFLVQRGMHVFLIDWGTPGREDRGVTFDYYVTGYLHHAIQHVINLSHQPRINVLGYGMGGTFTAIYTALNSLPVRNLIQFAAPINFHDDGVLSQWARKDRFNVDLLIDTLGTMPMELVQASFRMFKPTAQIMQQVMLADRFGDAEALQDFLALQSWFNSVVPFLGEAYRKYIKDCYQQNYLVQGKLVIDGRRVDLAHIKAPLLSITAARDYICPPRSAAILNELVSSSDKTLLELPASHIGIVNGRTAMELLWPPLADWLAIRSQQTLELPPTQPEPEALPEPAPAHAGVEPQAPEVVATAETIRLAPAEAPEQLQELVHPPEHTTGTNGNGTHASAGEAVNNSARPRRSRRKRGSEPATDA